VPRDRLSVADAVMLEMDGAGGAMHVGALLLLDGAGLTDDEGRVRRDLVRRHADATIHRVPRDRQRLRRVPGGVSRPVWVDDPGFDMGSHLDHATLTGRDDAHAELRAVASDYVRAPFPVDRPLWSLLTIDGLPDGSVAMVIRAHHAMLDGVSGIAWLLARLSSAPEEVSDDPPPAWVPEPEPTGGQLVTDALADHGRYLAMVGRYAGRAATSPRRATARARSLVRSSRSYLGEGVPAPLYSVNAPMGDRLGMATVALPLAHLREVRAAAGCTVNDVLLAASAGGLRRLLAGRGELDSTSRAIVFCAVSTRAVDDTRLGNQASALRVGVRLGEPDPVVRLREVHAETSRAKSSGESADLMLMTELTGFLTPAMVRPMARSVLNQTTFTMGVSNLVGPAQPLWFLGSRVCEFYPVIPPFRHTGVSVAAVSYDGTLYFGLRHDAEAAPDIDAFASGIVADVDQMLEWARG